MLANSIRTHIRSLDDTALVEYISIGIDGYEPEAAEFARQELVSRRVPTPAIIAAREIFSQKAAARHEVASRKLGWIGKGLAFLGGMSLIGLAVVELFSLRLCVRGEYGKIDDTYKWAAMGFSLAVVAGNWRLSSG